jgi:hypothetical protein
VTPTSVGDRGQGRELIETTWGFIPSCAEAPKVEFSNINARDDKVEESQGYRNAFKKSRCILPAAGFYESSPGQGVTPDRLDPLPFRGGVGPTSVGPAPLWAPRFTGPPEVGPNRPRERDRSRQLL